MTRPTLCLIFTFLLLIVGCTSTPASPTAGPSPATPTTVTPSPSPPRLRAVTRPSPTPSPSPVLTPAVTEITVWESLPPPQAELLADDVAAFVEEFPAYRVDLRHYESQADLMTAADRAAFDVVLAGPPSLEALWSAGQIAPMTDFFPPSFIDGFAAPTLVGATADEALWGLPDTTGFHLLLFYNRRLVDTPPADSAELFALAENLTGQGRWGLGLNSYDPLWLLPWLTPYGGWLTNETGQPAPDAPALEAALRLHQSWHTGAAAIAPVATYDEVRREFIDGNIGMVIDGEWAIGELSQVADLDWGVALLPRPADADNDQPAAPLILGRYWAISRTATGNRASAATTFVEALTRPERQLTWTDRFGLLPTRRSALNDPLIVNNPRLRPSAAQMLAGRALPLSLDATPLLDAMRDPLRRLVDGELTPTAAATEIEAAVRAER